MSVFSPEKEIRFDGNDDDSEESEDEDQDIDIEDAPPDEAAALRREVSIFLPDERAVCWKRKKVAKSSLHKPPL